jgi:hypothetical protein
MFTLPAVVSNIALKSLLISPLLSTQREQERDVYERCVQERREGCVQERGVYKRGRAVYSREVLPLAAISIDTLTSTSNHTLQLSPPPQILVYQQCSFGGISVA